MWDSAVAAAAAAAAVAVVAVGMVAVYHLNSMEEDPQIRIHQ
jgi:hypothetical protein